MKHLDTFSGIGGWALAARWMKWNTLAFVEKDKFCHKVLNKNFPGIPIHDDIFTFSGKPFRDRVGILTGSTPCQPFSQAGKREGSNDERHLFPEFLRVVAEVQPRWIVIENVYGLLSIESGRVFEEYHTSLESEGYAVQTICLPASALNAPHRRDRLWIVANSECRGCGPERVAGSVESICEGRENNSVPITESNSHGNDVENAITARCGLGTKKELVGIGIEWNASPRNDERLHHIEDDSDAGHAGLQRGELNGASGERTRPSRSTPERDSNVADPDNERYIRRREQGESAERAIHSGRGNDRTFSEPELDSWNGWGRSWVETATRFCRMDDVVPNRVDRLKSLGNAIVPQIAYEIFKAIETTEKDLGNTARA